MKNITKFLWALLPLMSVVLLTSCEEKVDPIDPNAPVINLVSTEVEAASNGGEYTVNYTITNVVEGQVITATPAADWVSVNTATLGIIKIEVEANQGDARQTSVKVEYKGAEAKNITVKQASVNEAPVHDDFYIEVAMTDYREYAMNVFPKDKETPYICMSATPDYIDELDLHEDQALFMDDMEYFDALGMWNGASIEEVLEARAKYGDQLNIRAGDGCPDSDYIFYVYHVDIENKTLASPITRVTVHTKAADLFELEFETTVSIDGPFVYVEEIYPKGTYNGYYYFDLFKVSDITASGMEPEKYVEAYFNFMTSDELAHMLTPNPSGITSERCSLGKDSYYVHLLAETDYYLAAFAVNELAICSSVPQMDILTTGGVEPSDMKISVEVKHVGPYAATVVYDIDIPDYYVTGYADTEYYESLGATDNERRDFLIKNFNFEYVNYSYSESLTNLEPSTNYTAFAFGAKGGVPTTDIVRVDFTTASDAPADITIDLKDLGYYDSKAVGALDATMSHFANYDVALFPIDIVVEPAGASSLYYYGIYIGDPYDEVNYRNGICYEGPKPQRTYYMLNWDQLQTFVAIVADEETGQYSNLVKKSLTPTRAEARDPQGFATWYSNWQSGNLMSSTVYDESATPAPKTMMCTAQNIVEKREIERYAQEEVNFTKQKMSVE